MMNKIRSKTSDVIMFNTYRKEISERETTEKKTFSRQRKSNDWQTLSHTVTVMVINFVVVCRVVQECCFVGRCGNHNDPTARGVSFH